MIRLIRLRCCQLSRRCSQPLVAQLYICTGSTPALTSNAVCFKNVFADMSGAQLDHYNFKIETTRPRGWRAFQEFLVREFKAKPVPRYRRNATNVVVIQRKENRFLLNANEIAEAAERVFSAQGPATVQVVFFETVSICCATAAYGDNRRTYWCPGYWAVQCQLYVEGSTVIRIKPYMLDHLVPGTGKNLEVIWDARHTVFSLDSNNTSTTRAHVSLKELQSAIDHADELPWLTKFHIAYKQDTNVTIDDFLSIAGRGSEGSKCFISQ